MKNVKAVAALFMTGVMLLTSGCVQKILGGISGKDKEYGSIVEKWKEGNSTIYDAYVCTPDDTFYDNPLYERG